MVYYLFLLIVFIVYDVDIVFFCQVSCVDDLRQVRELSLTIAYNKSDVTFGWNGFNNALTLYYMSQMEEFVSKDHRNVGLRVPFLFGRHNVVIPHCNQLDKVIL